MYASLERADIPSQAFTSYLSQSRRRDSAYSDALSILKNSDSMCMPLLRIVHSNNPPIAPRRVALSRIPPNQLPYRGYEANL